jgi:F-type H+-transporting ATPase subunit b
MTGSTQDIIIVAQAYAVQNGVVAPAEEHATDAAATHDAADAHATTETHASTEAHAEGGHFPPFDPAGFGGQLLWLAITFGALYLLMSRVALPQIGSIIDTRRARIDGDLAEAERLRKETEKASAAYEAALAEARKNAQAIAEETRASIKADIDNRRADVEAGLNTRISEAEARIAATKAAAMANVDDIAAETAQAVVARIAGDATVEEARDAVAAVQKG